MTMPEIPDSAPLAAIDSILLHGGQMLLLFESPEPLPTFGRVLAGEHVSAWQALSWSSGRNAPHWFGLAVLDGMPGTGSVLVCDDGGRRAIAPPLNIDVAPDKLVAFVRRGALDSQAVYAFLVRHLIEGRPKACEAARANGAFTRAFLLSAAEPDGFIEVLAAPEGGGLFAQGWSMSLEAGSERMTCVADDLVIHGVEIAHFDREDVLAPARGCCLFAKAFRNGIPAGLRAVCFERDGRLLRLDVVGEPLVYPDETLATQHVAAMISRLRAPLTTVRAFKRVCRARYPGTDTLSGTELPVAAAIDTLLQAPDGRILVAGWLLDPTSRVELVLVKGTDGLYAPIHRTWTRLPRPDLVTGFSADPRFANLLDPQSAMHGFVVQVLPENALSAKDAYLEVVLEDQVLFRPLRIARVESVESVAPLLPSLAPNEPEFGRIVADHLAPFLETLPSRPRAGRPVSHPMPLAVAGEAREVAAIMPVDDLGQLQPVMALLARAPEATALDLTLVLPRALARDGVRRLEDAFGFYGLSGQVIVARDSASVSERLDAGLEASSAPQVLAWLPSALPQRPGWLAELQEEVADLPGPGLISPALVYEDGSIFFAGQPAPYALAGCGQLGYARAWLEPGAPRPVEAPAPDIALVPRDLLVAAGGFSGHLFSGRYAHLDLAARLANHGMESWCSGRVAFWKLDELAPPADDPVSRILGEIDIALLARRKRNPEARI